MRNLVSNVVMPSNAQATAAGRSHALCSIAPLHHPFQLFKQWLAEAALTELSDPNAAALATVDSDGAPNVRMVLLKHTHGPQSGSAGFAFYTNVESTKGRELLACPRAALCLHWKSTRRQVRVRGAVVGVCPADTDAYFKTRPRGSRIAAWASQQSRPLASRFDLQKAVAQIAARYVVSDVPRPPYWQGFQLLPSEIEFWSDGPFRLHERVLYRKAPAHPEWNVSMLQP